MKKTVVFLLSLGMLFSCSSEDPKQENIQDQIAEYEAQIVEIQNKIAELEKQLEVLPGNPSGKTSVTAVRTLTLNLQPFSHYFEATGELESINEAYISPEVSGQITQVLVEEGQRVKKGQVVARLNTSVIEKNIAEVKTQLSLAETLYKKQKELWDKNIGSERQFLEAKTNYESLQNKLNTLWAQYEKSIIHSPIDGFVENILLKEGELASPGMQLMQIVNIDELYVTADLSEAHLDAVHVGDTVLISFPSFPGLKMERPVTQISNTINKQNRTFRIKIKVDNPDGRLKPNLLANILINDYNSPASIVVPSILIKEDMKGKYLFIAEQNQGKWVVRKKYVKTGVSYKDKTEVLEGLEVGQRVITDGYTNVSDGIVVKIDE